MVKALRAYLPVLMAAVAGGYSLNLHAADVTLYAERYPPYVFHGSDKARPGLDVELVVQAFERSGVDADVQMRPWNRIMRNVKSGDDAGALTCTDSPKRRDFVLLSAPTSQQTVGVVGKAEESLGGVQVINDLRQFSTVAVRGYATSQQLIDRDIPHFQAADMTQALNLVARRDKQLFYIGWEAAAQVAIDIGVRDSIRFYPLSDAPTKNFHICFSRQWPGVELLKQQFDSGLRELQQDGSVDQLRQKYGL